MVVRILVISILLYIGFRLVFGERKIRPKEPETKGKESLEDVLVEDPVCHNLVPKSQAVEYKYKGKRIYFCSEECCDTFANEKGEKE